jgi:hypothetical protein
MRRAVEAKDPDEVFDVRLSLAEIESVLYVITKYHSEWGDYNDISEIYEKLDCIIDPPKLKRFSAKK